MAGASISGLGSGLDTTAIISQLMQLESIPQTRLKSKLTTEQSTLKAIQDLNSRFAALTTAAADLKKPGAWSPLKATSSHEGVTVLATSGSAGGSLSLKVDQLAQAHSLRFTTTAKTSDVVVAPDVDGKHFVDLTIDGATKRIDAGDGTLGGLVNALNASGSGVRASTLNLGDGNYRLTVQAAKTGQGSTFTLTSSDGSTILGGDPTPTVGQDAQITVGTDIITSASNTFTGLLPGVDVTVSQKAVGQTVTLDLAGDATKARDQAKGFVDKINELLTQIEKLTAYDATTKKSGALGGNNSVRELRGKVLAAVFPDATSTMAGSGVQTDRYGKLVFDATAFDKAYAADPTATSAAFTGFSTRIETVAKAASNKDDGSLTSLATGSTSQIDRLQDNIDAWDTRLELREQTMTRQYTALDVALSKLNSQSSWLSGQISSMSDS